MLMDGKDIFASYDVIINEAVGERKLYGRLSESEVFQLANKATTIGPKKESLLDVIPKMMFTDKGFTHIEYENFDPTLVYEIFESNKFKSGNRAEIINAIKNGIVIPVYSEDYNIPTSIPYVFKMTSPATVYVNISDFVSMNQYGKVKVDQFRNYAGLYAVLSAAYISVAMMNKSITPNKPVIKAMTDLYAGMFANTVSRAVHLDPVLKQKIKYIASKFMLIQMYGTEMGSNIFYRNISADYEKSMGRMMCESVENDFLIDSYDSLSATIEEIKRMYPSCKKLTFNGFFEQWIKSYGSFSALSIDYVGYMIYILIALYYESPLVNRSALESLVSPIVVNAAIDYLDKI